MARKPRKRGDTLVEVMLAVGIFSMVAVAVVAVMSGGTSSSQTALETTLTREEIDNQAEALRFVQRSYISDNNTGTHSAFGTLWKAITDRAVNANNLSDESYTNYTKFSPQNCDDLYEVSASGSNAGEATSKGFVLNIQNFAKFENNFESNGNVADQNLLKQIIVTNGGTYDKSTSPLRRAQTYPHLIYQKNDLETNLIDHTSDATGDNSNLYAAEGIYIIAVRDPKGTSLVGSSGTTKPGSAYYDFYIRTCWYGTGDQSPSSISTVIRLYDPDLNNS